MNNSELAKKLGVSRQTVIRWEKQGVLKDKIAENFEPNVTPDVTLSENVTLNVTPNWQRNKNPITGKKYETKENAIATAIGMVTQAGYEIMLAGEVYYNPKTLDKS